MTKIQRHRPRCLAVRPAPAHEREAAGDEIIYGKSVPYLARFMEVEPASGLNLTLGALGLRRR